MTKDEQAIANLKKLKSVHNGSFGADIDRAIKALQQESVLDKIRAEIEEYNNSSWKPGENSLGNAGWWACNKCIEIIDKYKAEREG